MDPQRLWTLAAATPPDLAAFEALLRDLRRRPPALASLPALAKLPPHPEVWAHITALAEGLRGVERLDPPTLRLLIEADQALRRWPDTERQAPRPWLQEAAQGRAHVGWRLARAADWSGLSVSVSAAERLVGVAQEALGHLTWLDLSNKRWFAETWRKLLASPALASLRTLRLRDAALSAALVGALGESPHLDGLQSLDLSAGTGQAPQAPGLVTAPPALGGLDLGRWRLPALERLALGGLGLGRDGAHGLERWRAAGSLRALDLSRDQLDDVALYGLSQAPWACALEALDLSHNPLSGHAGMHLAEWPALAALRSLALARTDLPVDALLDLLDGPFAQTLAALDLSENPTLHPDGAQALAGAALPALGTLRLARCRLDAAGLEVLLAAPWFGQLEALDLSHNPIGDAGVRALVRSGRAGRLRSLALAGCHLSADGAEALAVAALPALETLDLSENPLGKRGALAFTSPQRALHMPTLTTLDLRQTRAWQDTAAALAASPHLSGVRVLL